eukprot:6191185-Pleurochrysis_carterae.AAC.2
MGQSGESEHLFELSRVMDESVWPVVLGWTASFGCSCVAWTQVQGSSGACLSKRRQHVVTHRLEQHVRSLAGPTSTGRAAFRFCTLICGAACFVCGMSSSLRHAARSRRSASIASTCCERVGLMPVQTYLRSVCDGIAHAKLPMDSNSTSYRAPRCVLALHLSPALSLAHICLPTSYHT